MFENIYEYPADALVQFCFAEPAPDEPGQWVPGEHIEDVDGAEATRVIAEAMNNGAEPLYVDGFIMGFCYNDEYGRPVIYTDCDEQTYEEYYGEPWKSRIL